MKFGIACVLALVAIAAPMSQAQTAKPAAEKTTATLTMTFELKGAGIDRPASNERNISWKVHDRYTLTATMTAQKPGGFGAMHKPDAGEQAREAERAQAAQQAQASMQPMMAQAEQIMKACGEDQACIQREVMKMAQGINPNSPEMQSARSNMAKASVMPGTRYQLFGGATQSATFAIEETAREAYFDAACSLATEARCAYDTVVRGEGDVLDQAGNKQTRTSAMAELDFQSGTLMLNLALPGFGKAKKTVTSQNPHIKTGTTDVLRGVKGGDMGNMQVKVNCGACEGASGTIEKDVTDELLRRPAKLVVHWTFKRS